MVKEIRIYFEGDKKLREGFSTFFNSVKELARSKGVSLRPVASGGTPIRDFMKGLRSNPDSINILLKDSEGPDDGNLIANTKNDGNWDDGVGSGVRDDQIHFMVQFMESWFLADRDCLKVYYNRNFHENSLSRNPRVEEIAISDVERSLENATRDTTKGRYHKTRHAPQLLARIDVNKVRAAAPACERLFESLRRIIARA